MIRLSFLIACLIFRGSTQMPSENDWRGFSPFKSTRMDVERRLGPPDQNRDNKQLTYNFPDVVVYFYFNSNPKCRLKLPSSSWAVTPDTVTGIDVNLLSAFEKASRHPDVQFVLFEKYVQSTDQPGVRERLDALATFLTENPEFTSYIVSYAGRRSCRGDALRRATTARDYLIRKKRIKRHQITIIDGGYRPEWEVQLWFAAANAQGAVPITNTIDKNQVQVTKNSNR